MRLREPFSGLSHLFGAVLAAVGLVVLLCVTRKSPYHLSGFAIYGASLILLYLASALYHLLPVGPHRVRQLLVFDQVAIYLLIAGTYTPICLTCLRGPWGWSLLAVIWGLAAIGITLRFAWRSAPPWLCVALYLVMGWLAVAAAGPLLERLSPVGVGWLGAGGVTYTAGAVVFATGRPRLWPGRFGSHDLWHLFVLGGSACHYAVMLLLALPG